MTKLATCPNTHYKCHGFYCIPWRYVCDGMWQCPQGTEENEINCNRTSCPNQFHCRNSSICLHLSSFCDGNGLVECPFGDDEHICEIEFLSCPYNCFCLLYSIICRNKTFVEYTGQLIYTLISMTHCRFLNIQDSFIYGFDHVTILHFPQNNISTICTNKNVRLKKTDIIYLDLYANIVMEISPGCFKNMPRMWHLNLSWNAITTIGSKIFRANSSIKYVDLSFNNLLHLKQDIFTGVTTLIMLKLSNNSMRDISIPALMEIQHVDIIITNNNKICCLIQQIKTWVQTCKTSLTWPKSCDRLIATVSAQAIRWIVGVVGVLLNVVTLIYIPFKCSKKKRAKYCYMLIVMMIAISDVLSCFGLQVYWSHLVQIHYIKTSI